MREAGGKARTLLALKQAGFAVPDLALLDGSCFERFLGAGFKDFLQLARRGEDTADSLQAIIDARAFDADLRGEIEREVGALRADKVAVRSTAPDEDGTRNSFAGIHESCLNVTGAELPKAIKAVWKSYFSAHAFAYRQARGLPAPQTAEVFVQSMIAPEMAGVCFTANPVNNRRDQMLIEAVRGLGAPLVSGEITPDTIIVWRRDGKFALETYIMTPQERMLGADGFTDVPMDQRDARKVGDEEIQSIAGLAARIEAFQGSPQDIEWAFADGRLYVLQSRAITTLT